MTNDTTVLLGLDGLASEKVEVDLQGRPVVHLATTDPHAARCPDCRQVSRIGRPRLRSDWRLLYREAAEVLAERMAEGRYGLDALCLPLRPVLETPHRMSHSAQGRDY